MGALGIGKSNAKTLPKTMATTKAVIRSNRINSKGQTPIFIRYTHNQKSTLFAVGQMIDPKHWDSSGFVKRTLRGYTNINALIEKKRRIIDDLRIELLLLGTDPTIDAVNKTFRDKYEPKQEDLRNASPFILDHWENFVRYQLDIKRVRKSTLKPYGTAKKRLEDFQTENNVRLKFDQINMDFYEKLLYYMYGKMNCSPNSVGFQVKVIKTFMNWAVDREKLTTNVAYKQFTKPKNPTQIFTIDQEKLEHLFTLDLSDDIELEKVRDLFVLSCTTGLRFSDYSRLKPENIKDDHIIINTRKTNDTAIIPLTKYSKPILQKYQEGVPFFDDHFMNKKLKVLGRKAGFDDIHEVATYKGGRKQITKVKFSELMTTHMGRRTFITQSLERGMLPSTVMKITTHRDQKSFASYINTTKERIRTEITAAWND